MSDDGGASTESLFSAWADTWLRASFRDWDIQDLLSRVECPALVIQGADDGYGTEEQAWTMATGIGPKAQVLLIANCGHIPHRQSRSAVLRHMRKMIDRT